MEIFWSKNDEDTNAPRGITFMKPSPPPNVPGETEAARFDFAVRKMFSVSKEDVVKEEAKQARARARKRGSGNRSKGNT
jgi:hypothetical protein